MTTIGDLVNDCADAVGEEFPFPPDVEQRIAHAVIRCTLKWVAAKDDAITTGDILLAAGEMSRQEIRTVCAVLRWRSDRLRSFVSTLEAANAAETTKEQANGFRRYRRTQIAEMRPWNPCDDMGGVSVSKLDRENGSPQTGDMIARNPKNHADQWLVAAQYFADNFESTS